MAEASERIYVIGAGIIGVSCALELCKAGYRVTIISKDRPGQCCSFGAAGNYGGNVHFAIPNIALKVPGMYLNKRHPFSFYFRDALPLSRWFRGYRKASEPVMAKRIADTFGELGRDVYETYSSWLKDAGEERLIVKRGRLFVWTTKAGFENDRYSIEFRKKQGIALDILTTGQVQDLEPSVPEGIVKGAYAPESGHILNPMAVVEVLAQDFLKRGGRMIDGEVRHIVEGPQEVRIESSAGAFTADQVIVAMGIDSGEHTKPLGVNVPLIAERGYHVMFDAPSFDLKIPVMWEERKVLFTGMDLGLRVAGIAEFMARARPPREKFARLLEKTTQEFFPQLRHARADSDWAGRRPVTPDYLPVIGRTRKDGRVICAYGHGHSGYWFAPGTTRLVREIVTRQFVSKTALEMMSPGRFT